jgi:AraC family transcriptional regulator
MNRKIEVVLLMIVGKGGDVVEWLDRMKDAIDFIEDNLTEQIDMEDVAMRAYSSSFHFQRMFHMLTNVTVAEYIRKRRLTLAAQDLCTSSDKILDIALKYAYESPESFAKAFRKVHGISPSDARNQNVQLKAFPRISFHLSLKGDKDVEYRIVNREAFGVIGKMIRVSSKDGENFRRIPQFWEECYVNGTVDKLRAFHPEGVLYGICMDTDHESEEFTYAIAVEGKFEHPDEAEWSKVDIPASTWAVFPSAGSLPNAIHDVWRRIFEEWFPATGYQHSGGPEVEFLPPGDDLSADYRCEVWVPVVKS